jgi:hypothetical protein
VDELITYGDSSRGPRWIIITKQNIRMESKFIILSCSR